MIQNQNTKQMISFYPGPSKIYPQVREFMLEAYDSGILSSNHRSTEFISLSEETISLMKEKLNIPQDYTVFYTSSATECWEIIGQSFISLNSFHIYNGAFGKKWLDYRNRLNPNSSGHSFGIDEIINLEKTPFSTTTEVLCLTQNETSNGTQVSNTILTEIRQKFQESIICIDATSSMGGVVLEWENADIWLASVQKCFGLPAGMGLMICSPKAIKKAIKFGHNQHYNSLSFMTEKMQDFQTTITPNVLNVFLLNRVLKTIPNISEIHQKLKARKEVFLSLCEEKKLFQLSENEATLSDTVFAIKGTPEEIEKLKSEAKKKGILFGNGYGKWKNTSFRIANFPALENAEWGKLYSFFKNV